jgi:Inner membrane component of T3SS, cytoplasmic domain/Domain of unknown function (DUF1707)
VGLSLASPSRARPSRADRERVADVLRRACADERLSSETFVGRLDLVYAARTRAELERLLADLPEPTAARRVLLGIVSWSSGISREVSHAWRGPRIPRMVLPLRDRVVVGRSPHADFIVADQTVSSTHAVLSHERGAWRIEDSGSTNGTFLNGWRVTDSILVRPGDELTLGETTFVLAAPSL